MQRSKLKKPFKVYRWYRELFKNLKQHTGSSPAAKSDAPSVAPAGTVFTGLSIFKDRADPVAKPDHEYPNWLWDLLEDPAIKPSKSLIAGDVDTTGMSKGEARAAYKRSAKLARQQLKRQQAAEAKEAARQLNMSPQQKAASQAKLAAQVAKEAQPKSPSEQHEDELKARRTLRKKNRAAIKASNFVKST
ncbi:hypothetical protein MYAM1_002012 [Malassezia yamatoensis]|uniref:Large ribosomal subunit protein mL54 n=1 Tax=Malassezia yamatoensis TaxID=253288 RepID=A0AAJ6CHX7_9BASI|nr:hypothetical protein MYAM1_002012 [Malassezia yamatoensis]